MITVKIPAFSYNKQLVLKDVSAEFTEAQTHGIIGLNGAGKTTFFNLLAGYLKNEDSTFLRDGQPLRRKDIAFIDTDLFLYPKLTAKEFLSVFPKTNASYDEEKLAELFRLPLDGFTEQFSTGMKKKLILLSQLKQDKDIYILDEPFNGLDLETNRMLEVIIRHLNEKGKTVFISSHILDPLLNVCSRMYYLKHNTLHRTYDKTEFKLIEEELFGAYTRELSEKLKTII